MVASNLLQIVSGTLKQENVYNGIHYNTTEIRVALLAWDKNLAL